MTHACLIDLTGQRFGSRVVLSLVPVQQRHGESAAFWVCKCDCGDVSKVHGAELRKGKAQRCTSCATRLHWQTKRARRDT